MKMENSILTYRNQLSFCSPKQNIWKKKISFTKASKTIKYLEINVTKEGTVH